MIETVFRSTTAIKKKKKSFCDESGNVNKILIVKWQMG